MKRLLISALAISALASQSGISVASEHRVATERFTEYARVISVEPVYRNIRVREPRQECWVEEQEHIVGYENTRPYEQYRAPRDKTGSTIVGSLIGGVIGNQLGRGNSRSSRAGATVAGAIIGGAIGSEAHGDVSRHRRYEYSRDTRHSRPIVETRPVERCKQVVESRSEQRLQHYNVTYQYRGREFTTQLPRDPGERLELQVSIAPARR